MVQDENDARKVSKPLSWIHSDIMDDNIHMEPFGDNSCFSGASKDAGLVDNGYRNSSDATEEGKSWRPSHILDFSDLSMG